MVPYWEILLKNGNQIKAVKDGGQTLMTSFKPIPKSSYFFDPLFISLSMDFSRQKYWSGLLFPPPGDLPNPGIKPISPALAGRFFITEPPGKLVLIYRCMYLVP